MAVFLNDKYKPEDRYHAIVDHGNGLLVVCAGPGTGKTFSLLRKIESLLSLGIEPAQIYYLTFVNSIIDAFKLDITKPPEEGGLGKSANEIGIKISTLHGMALKIVKTYSQKLGLPEQLEIIDLEPRSESVLTKIFLQDLVTIANTLGITGSKKEIRSQLKEIVKCWRKNVDIPDTHRALNDCILKMCKRYHVCPWDFLVPTANNAIKKYGLPKWLKDAKHFLIDEYQDFNPSEQYLITLITEPSDSVIIVGDPDQSIYSGRAASPTGIKTLLERCDTYSVNFVYCRRCPKAVIKIANNLLKTYIDPTGFATKELQTLKSDDGEVKVLEVKSCKAELEYLVSYIREWQQKREFNIILLFPSKKAKDFYSKKLGELGITCLVQIADQSAEKLKLYLKLVRLQSHPFLERFMLANFKNLERKYVSEILLFLADFSDNLIVAIHSVSAQKKWKGKTIQDIKTMELLFSQLTSKTTSQVSTGLKTLGYELSDEIINGLLNEDDTRNSNEIVDDIIEQISANSSADTSGCADGVQLLTMHSAKGLSKPVVIIPAFEDKWLPGPKDGEFLAEQHRLFYVAVTRTEKALLLTYPKTRAKGDPLNYFVKNTQLGISRYAKAIV